ncbi:MAG TPA: hypothetical protein VH302_07195 [Bryobacteraceae bacterium]|jgi:hypothetical protein|nr:hypothetical protein [Bryobacteraceae bacterium]
MSDNLSDYDWFWTAAGKAIGYRDDEALFSSCGTQIGVFRGDEVYGVLGSYLGEVSNSGRLVADIRKLNWRRPAFTPDQRDPLELPMDIVAQQLTPGYRHFRFPEKESIGSATYRGMSTISSIG